MAEIVLFYLLYSSGHAPLWAYLLTGISVVLKGFLVYWFFCSFRPIKLTDEEFREIHDVLDNSGDNDGSSC